MKYTIPLHIFFHYTRIMEKDLCRGLYTSLFCVIIPTLFPYFLRFWYPYILLHFKCFLLLVNKLSVESLIWVQVYVYVDHGKWSNHNVTCAKSCAASTTTSLPTTVYLLCFLTVNSREHFNMQLTGYRLEQHLTTSMVQVRQHG